MFPATNSKIVSTLNSNNSYIISGIITLVEFEARSRCKEYISLFMIFLDF